MSAVRDDYITQFIETVWHVLCHLQPVWPILISAACAVLPYSSCSYVTDHFTRSEGKVQNGSRQRMNSGTVVHSSHPVYVTDDHATQVFHSIVKEEKVFFPHCDCVSSARRQASIMTSFWFHRGLNYSLGDNSSPIQSVLSYWCVMWTLFWISLVSARYFGESLLSSTH